MLTDSFVSTDRRVEFVFASTIRRVELYLDEDKSNTGWRWYWDRCNENKLEDEDRSIVDLGVERGRLIADMFLDED